MKFPIQYDPSKGDKQDFLAKAMAARPDKPFEGPIALSCCFYFSRPKSHFGSGKNSMTLKPAFQSKWKTSKPDLDNCLKMVADALNAVFWRDDCQIISMCSQKQYCDPEHLTPGAQITITEIF
jgi:Holliday junction resolvase RusA-like endonuclease